MQAVQTGERPEIRRYEYERYEAARFRLSLAAIVGALYLLFVGPMVLGMWVISGNAAWMAGFIVLSVAGVAAWQLGHGARLYKRDRAQVV